METVSPTASPVPGVLVVIDDAACGKVQIGVLRQALERHLPSVEAEYVLASELKASGALSLEAAEDWELSTWVSDRLLVRYHVLLLEEATRFIVFVDGGVLLSGWDETVWMVEDSWRFCAERGVAMADQALFVVPPANGSANASELRSALKYALKAGYEYAADYVPEFLRDLPDAMAATRLSRDQRRVAVACIQVEDRPWLFANAFRAEAWNAGLRDAWREGAFDREDMLADEKAGLVRPSILFCCEYDLWDLPRDEIARLDALFPRNAITTDQGLRDILCTTVFIPPGRPGGKGGRKLPKIAKSSKNKAQQAKRKDKSRQLSDEDLLELLSKTPRKKVSRIKPDRSVAGPGSTSLMAKMGRVPGILFRAAKNPQAYYARLKEVLRQK